jgi:hypothetical protein
MVSSSSKSDSSIFLPVNRVVSSAVNFSLVLVRPFFILSAKLKKPLFFSSFGGAFSSFLISIGFLSITLGVDFIGRSDLKVFFFSGGLGALVTFRSGAGVDFFCGFLTTSFFAAGFFSGLSFFIIFFRNSKIF